MVGKSNMKQVTIITDSWNANREIICFKLTGSKTLELLPGSYEGTGDFVNCNPGNYAFVHLHDWLWNKVK